MKEEFVTKAILKFLRDKGYFVIAFDFPQSGTGVLLHPDTPQDRNEGIKPDIIALKDKILIMMENKDRYWKGDFEKLHELKTTGNYTHSLNKLHMEYNTSALKVGIGIPNSKRTVEKVLKTKHLVDFIIAVDEQGKCEIIWGNV
ncbi:MAG: hypothetical protein H5T85_04430 [Actinobacteria bacterium]|nr:hypothetical protein [Actinomycetota bacterium]